MDKAEADEILSSVISELRTRSFDELRGMVDDPRTESTTGASGMSY